MASFGAEDFIGFDFADDAGGAQSQQVENLANTTSAHAGPSKLAPPSRKSKKASKTDGSASLSDRISSQPVPPTATDTPKSTTSTGSKGKKRKYDDEDDEGDVFDASMTKRERERAAARGTPWSVNVNWDTARNAAQQ